MADVDNPDRDKPLAWGRQGRDDDPGLEPQPEEHLGVYSGPKPDDGWGRQEPDNDE